MSFKVGDIVLISGVKEKDNYHGTHIYNGKNGIIYRVYDGGCWVKFGKREYECQAFANEYLTLMENK